MKKLTALIVALLGISALSAQPRIGDIRSITFYGVDFSAVRINGANESPADFIRAFGQINQLFMSEPNKYNPAKAFKMQVDRIDLSVVRSRNENIDKAQLAAPQQSDLAGYTVDDGRLAEIVASYPVDGEGYGAVIVAERLDKTEGRALFTVVFFDRQSREVIYSQCDYAKAGGFGLRNYWAGALYNMLKKWRF